MFDFFVVVYFFPSFECNLYEDSTLFVLVKLYVQTLE